MTESMTEAVTQIEIDQRVFDLHDDENRGLNPYLEDVARRAAPPRYHEASARPAWERAVAFFKQHPA